MNQIHKIQVVMVEDETNVSSPISAFINQQEDMAMAGVFPTVESFLQEIDSHVQPAVLLLDISLPNGMSGIEGIPSIKHRFPSMDIIMLTTANDVDTIFSALRTGATSYLDKTVNLDEVINTIRVVVQGGSYMSPKLARKIFLFLQKQEKQTPASNQNPAIQLTKKQMKVVRGLVDGLSYKLIAAQMNISVETVRSHIKTIYRRLDVNSKTEVIGIYHKDMIREKED